MNHDFVPAWRWRCACCAQAGGGITRRTAAGALLGGGLGLAVPTLARDGVDVERSKFTKFVPAEQVEQSAAQQYAQMKAAAQKQNALGPTDHPQVRRLRYIAERMIPHTYAFNERAKTWQWEVNLIGSKEVNAFCMPGGKIAFYYGILDRLKLDDDEVAVIMGHEAGHALLEHAREQLGKNVATRAGASILSGLLGLGSLGDAALSMGAQLLSLKYSRSDETEADLIGIELAARSGYKPASGVSLWEKMGKLSQGNAPPGFLSTHPTGPDRIRRIQENLPKVDPLFAKAGKPDQRYAPPEAGKG